MDFHKHEIKIYECGPISSAQLATEPGVYFIFVGEPHGEGDFLYIGRSKCAVSKRIEDHLENDMKEADCWNRVVSLSGKSLRFAACEIISNTDRKEIEAALIYYLQPCCNDNHRKEYDGRSVEINVNCQFPGFYVPTVIVRHNSIRRPRDNNNCSCRK